ncbi:gastrula zinc finger protein XlCGF46.1-like isoform X2 [Uranotaenia lowii]|uniref:gastrula zinc finger protein XlCGF46.1-like isoform X2 n=1 Tax=Uranotaenia lowii TaxID=190385 RepID=UPI002478AF1F|nr:gastrula zinc finger protein XlCGF46.1-like isoform X2 [Uranotaenia lowii]
MRSARKTCMKIPKTAKNQTKKDVNHKPKLLPTNNKCALLAKMDAIKHELTFAEATSFCRLCLKTDQIELIVQSPAEEVNEPALTIISECLGIWLAVNEDFPFGICHPCALSLEGIRQFRYNCQQCDSFLRDQRAKAVADENLEPTGELHHETVEYHHEEVPLHQVGLEGPVGVLQENGMPEEVLMDGNHLNLIQHYEDQQQQQQQMQQQQHQQNLISVATEQPLPLKKFDCPECGKRLFSSRMLAQHVVREHRLCHGCGNCGMAYDSQSKLDNHKASCNGRPSKFLCNQCPSAKVFSTAISLSVHLYYAHDSIKSVVYRCEACKKNFKNRTGLRYHYSTQHGCAMVECEICRRPFPTEESLYYHKQADH